MASEFVFYVLMQLTFIGMFEATTVLQRLMRCRSASRRGCWRRLVGAAAGLGVAAGVLLVRLLAPPPWATGHAEVVETGEVVKTVVAAEAVEPVETAEAVWSAHVSGTAEVVKVNEAAVVAETNEVVEAAERKEITGRESQGYAAKIGSAETAPPWARRSRIASSG